MPLQKPEYHPKFSKSDLRQVEEVLRRRTAPQVQVQRARLAKLLHSEPKVDNMDASRRLGVHHQFVRKWRRRWATTGFSLEDEPRPGRPDLTSTCGHRYHRWRPVGIDTPPLSTKTTPNRGVDQRILGSNPIPARSDSQNRSGF